MDDLVGSFEEEVDEVTLGWGGGGGAWVSVDNLGCGDFRDGKWWGWVEERWYGVIVF